MAVVRLTCCDAYIDLDWNLEGAIHYEGEYYCYEHLLDHLMDKLGMTEDQADSYIDNQLV